VEPLHREARLPAVEEAADGDGASRGLQVSVSEADARVAAAELERALLQCVGRPGHNLAAGRSGARQGDLADEGMADDRVAGRRSENHVDDALGQAALDESLD